MYNLTAKQQEGLEICVKRYKDKKPYTIIAGYAGTGKSYLVNAIVDNFGFKENQVAYACYTGKAALVLQRQGKNAITLHKLLYTSYPNGMGGFYHKPKDMLDPNLKLIIVDEISMCPKELWQLLLKHKIYIIGLGDPFQLPPIGEDLGLLDYPHVFLTEVMRQALDNDIIKYSMDLREGKKLQPGIRGKNIQTYSKNEYTTGMLKWADQILCGKNDTRRMLNEEMRKILGKEGILAEDDKLICTKNYWDLISTDGNFLVNGSIGNIKNVKIENNKVKGEFLLGEDNSFGQLPLDYNLLTTGKPTVLKAPNGKIKRNPHIEMDYGYAITVHKSQGSQFDKVLVFDEHLYHEENHNRWLYTAITRAVDKVVVIL
jgi:exodeoxyribonuclease-5